MFNLGKFRQTVNMDKIGESVSPIWQSYILISPLLPVVQAASQLERL